MALGLACYPTALPPLPRDEPSRPPPRVTGRPPPAPPESPSEVPLPGSLRCLEGADASAYLSALKEAVFAKWRLASAGAGGTAHLSFILGKNGELAYARLVAAESPELGDGALAALSAAQPFGTVPDAARCLVGARLTAVFRLDVKR